MHCRACGFDNPAQMRFCGSCGQALGTVCPQCAVENPPGFRFCGGCGTPLTATPIPATVAPASPAPGPEADRRQLTVLFCDLIGSTALSDKLDPEDMRELLREYQGLCAEAVARYHGHIAQYLGDGLLVYFGYPLAHEDDAVRAVHAGLEIVRVIQRRGGHQMRTEGHRLAVRVGIHTGPVVAGRVGFGESSENLAIGKTPNLAARLQNLAEPDTVLLSDTTYQLVRGFFRCQSLGERSLKGISVPIEVYQVEAPSGARSRFEVVLSQGLAPAVGRQRELAELLAGFARSCRGQCQVALVAGEAGIGKSRLLQLLVEKVASDQPRWLICRCSPFHQHSAFNPVIELGQQVLGLRSELSPAKNAGRLARRLEILGFGDPESVSLLAALLSLPLGKGYRPLDLGPRRQKEKTLDLLVAVFAKMTEIEPVVLAVEDLHWIDASTLELLDRLVRRPPAARLFVLGTHRPSFTHSWTPAEHVTEVTLQPLGNEDVASIVREIAANRPLPGEVLDQIVRRTDGVPLFVEELTKAILESDLPLSRLAIPATLEDSLRARLDRLGSAKWTGQIAAVAGRTFSYGLLRLVSPHPEEELQRDLSALVAAELLYQKDEPPDATYTFKHALIQEAAYNSILRTARRQIHGRIAEALTQSSPEIVATRPELLAHHYSEAGLPEPAARQWLRAGTLATDHSAEVEAVAHLHRGLTLLEQIPESPERLRLELELQSTLGRAWSIRHGFAAPEVEQAYRRALELCSALGDIPQVFSVLLGLWSFSITRADMATAKDIAGRLLSQAESMRHPPALLAAHFALGLTYFFLGDFATSREHLEESIALDALSPRAPASAARVDPGVMARCYAGLTAWSQGHSDQGLAHVAAALDLAGRLDHAYSRTEAHFFAAWMHRLRGEIAACRDHAGTAVQLCDERGFGFWRDPSMIMLCAARAVESAAEPAGEDGCGELLRALASYRAGGSRVAETHYLSLLIQELHQRGRNAEAGELLADAFRSVESTGEVHWLAELHRLRGELALACPEPGRQEAEASFEEALAVARRQGAASLELRAAISQARLRIGQGRRAEALESLAAVYARFTEGFSTADLAAARQLLDATPSGPVRLGDDPAPSPPLSPFI
jgi:class 3 adenylate cyclase/predicted ATPase